MNTHWTKPATNKGITSIMSFCPAYFYEVLSRLHKVSEPSLYVSLKTWRPFRNINMQPNKSTAEWPPISRKPYLRYYNTQHQLKIIMETRSLANICRAEALTQLYSPALTINQPLRSHSAILLCTTHTYLFYISSKHSQFMFHLQGRCSVRDAVFHWGDGQKSIQLVQNTLPCMVSIASVHNCSRPKYSLLN